MALLGPAKEGLILAATCCIEACIPGVLYRMGEIIAESIPLYSRPCVYVHYDKPQDLF